MSIDPEKLEADGRNRRHQRTHAAMLEVARASMRSGIFRPSMMAVAKGASVGLRTTFDHFETQERMLVEALEDLETQTIILALVLNDSLPPQTNADRIRLLHAIVLGRA